MAPAHGSEQGAASPVPPAPCPWPLPLAPAALGLPGPRWQRALVTQRLANIQHQQRAEISDTRFCQPGKTPARTETLSSEVPRAEKPSGGCTAWAGCWEAAPRGEALGGCGAPRQPRALQGQEQMCQGLSPVPGAPWLATRCGHHLPSVATEGRRQAQGGGGDPVRFPWPRLEAGLGGVGCCWGSPSGVGAWAGRCEELRGRCGAHSPLCFLPQTKRQHGCHGRRQPQRVPAARRLLCTGERGGVVGRAPGPPPLPTGGGCWQDRLGSRALGMFPAPRWLPGGCVVLSVPPALLCCPKDPRGRVSCGCREEVGARKRLETLQGRAGEVWAAPDMQGVCGSTGDVSADTRLQGSRTAGVSAGLTWCG